VRRLAVAVVGAAVVFTLALAGCARRESDVERVARVRRQFRIQPNGFQPRAGAGGVPEVVVSVLVVNEGRERLDRLTLRVHVQGSDGRDRASATAVVDTSALLPGVAAQLSAIARGVEVAEGETVLVELEDAPAADGLAAYPEFAATGGAR